MNPKQKSILSKIFAIFGTILLWAPILFMCFTAIVGSFSSKSFLFDYLTLAEMFPILALGLVLLVLASLFSHTFAKWFGWGGAAAMIALGSGLLFATASGAAGNAFSSQNIVVTVIIVAVSVFNLLVVALAILGILLVRRLFQKAKPEPVLEA